MKDIDYARIGKKIQIRRKELDISQEKLAELCDISSSYVGHIERGSRRLSLNMAVKICDVLSIGLDYLFLDFAQEDDEIIICVKSALKNSKPHNRQNFINTIKILAENIDKM